MFAEITFIISHLIFCFWVCFSNCVFSVLCFKTLLFRNYFYCFRTPFLSLGFCISNWGFTNSRFKSFESRFLSQGFCFLLSCGFLVPFLYFHVSKLCFHKLFLTFRTPPLFPSCCISNWGIFISSRFKTLVSETTFYLL